MKRRALPVALALAAVLSAHRAAAGDAERLFSEGVKLLDQNRVEEACPKLEESQRLEPAAGTLLNLAACYERSGRRALALGTFRKAADASRRRGRSDWEKLANDHIRRLAAELPALTVSRGGNTGPLEVELDGEPLPAGELGVARPVDPGRHALVARSAGLAPYAKTFSVDGATTIVIPPLAPASAGATEPPPEGGLETRQAIGIALASVGVATIAFGAVGAFVAGDALDEAKASCPAYPTRCSRAAEEPNGRAETWSTVATGAFVAGGVLAAAGATLFLWPRAPARPRVGLDPAGRVWLGGRF